MSEILKFQRRIPSKKNEGKFELCYCKKYEVNADYSSNIKNYLCSNELLFCGGKEK